MTRRFIPLWLALAAGCGFTDKAREQPPDLGPHDGRTTFKDAAPDAAPADGPADGPSDGAGDGPPAGWVCDPEWYSDLACDCGCGAPDPTCGGGGCSTVDCCVAASCAALGCNFCGVTGDGCDFPDSGVD